MGALLDHWAGSSALQPKAMIIHSVCGAGDLQVISSGELLEVTDAGGQTWVGHIQGTCFTSSMI